ncbi:MAG: putative ABC transporter ATP-binding protein [Candidatus Bathyarchaeota archaeon BA1]|nr:MAG: putative ABC transporter ATP-binding protein [Candidatus Bathyarchaeota archaeon BA1]
MKKPIVRVVGLSKNYSLKGGGKVRALENISFDLHRKEILGIIGRSGGGKTTLIRVLRGVEPFDGGEIWINDIHLTPKASEEDLRKVHEMTAIHLQRSFGLWAASALENVMRRLHALETGSETALLPPEEFAEYGKLKEEGERMLEAVGLTHKADHPAHTLSGGEKQRLVLARQLATAGREPKILLLDEPVTMTCPATKQVALDWLKSAREQFDVSTIVASHLPVLLKYVADRVIWLEGKILDVGKPDEVVDKFLAQMEPVIGLKPMPKSKRAIIKVQNLTKSYHAEVVGESFKMERLNLKIYDGEILALVGPSGVGKTVLIRLLSGLELPDGGKIIYGLEKRQTDITKLGYKTMMTRRRVGIVHQELDLAYHATVKDLASARLGIKGERALVMAKKRARELGLKEETVDSVYRLGDYPERVMSQKLEELRLDKGVIRELFPVAPWEAVSKAVGPMFRLCSLPLDLLDRKSHELSWGERIRVAIALELLSGPKVLFLDEPFGDLDPITLRSLSNVLKLINEKFKVTTVLVSHHVDFVREVAHRAILMREGKIVEEGPPAKICGRFIRESHSFMG